MTPRKLVPLVVLCGTIALAVWGAARLGVIGSSAIENNASGDRGATRGETPLSDDASGAVDAPLAGAKSSVAAAATSHPNLPAPAVTVGRTAVADPLPPQNALAFEAPSPESRPTPQLKTPAQ